MIVYDCDDDAQFTELADRTGREDLLGRNLLASFGPDDLAEAVNRGFTPR